MLDGVFDINDMVELEKDKDSLGKAVNGADNEDVVTRLGAKYPTLNKAIKTIMSKAPINSTPFATKSDLLADTTLADNALAFVYNDVDANNGLYKKVSGVWQYQTYNLVTQAKIATNTNFYRSNLDYVTAYNAVAFDQANVKADYSASQIIFKGLNIDGGFEVPITKKLRSKISLWVKVKSAKLNNGTNMRFLVQVNRQDDSKIMSFYAPINDGVSGWVLLGETALNDADRQTIKNVNIRPQITGGAELVIEDFYIGENSPLLPFVRDDEADNVLISRTIERNSVLPHWLAYPSATGVTFNENGDIILQPNTSYKFSLPVADVNKLYYCGFIEQSRAGDIQIYFKGNIKANNTANNIPFYPLIVNGEFSDSVTFDGVIDKVDLTITNTSSNVVALRSFELDYNPVSYNGSIKVGNRFDENKLKTDIVKATQSPTIYQNYATSPNFENVEKSSDGNRYAVNGAIYSEKVSNGNIEKGTTYYISMPDLDVKLNGGTASFTVFQNAKDNSFLTGGSYTLKEGIGSIDNQVVTSSDANFENLNYRFDLSGGATVKLGRLIISKHKYSDFVVFNDYYKYDETGVVASTFEHPKLTGYIQAGNAVDYAITQDGADNVLTIPNTGVDQTAKYIINVNGATHLSFEAKLNAGVTNNTKLWLRYFRDGSNTELTALQYPLTINKDGSWTLNNVFIPKSVNGYDVKYVEMYITNLAASTSPLSVKRFIQSVDIHNPYVGNINYVGDSQDASVTDFLRLTDALSVQPQSMFTVGRQIFRPIAKTQKTLADYELINGKSYLPKQLSDLRYIDSKGYEIAAIDKDDNVYLVKGTSLYKTTVNDLVSRSQSSSVVGTERKGVFDDSNLMLVTASVPSGWMRITGDGTFVIVSRAAAYYSLDKGVTWQQSSGYQDVMGEHYNAWGTDCCDNVVITSGYHPAPERGTGGVNYSSDNGKTYSVILDLQTSNFIDRNDLSAMHIHSVKYDPYWKGVWVIMGDGNFANPNSSVISNIWFITNPATPQQSMISFNSRGKDWTNEQHVSVHPMQDCILFGSDANPTGLYRMARSKDPQTLRDKVYHISDALSHYGCGSYQHKSYLPVSLYFGKDEAGYSGSLNDIVFLTYDGVNVVDIYREPSTSNATGLKVNCLAYALDSHFIFERRGDNRFTSGNTWVIGGIKYTP